MSESPKASKYVFIFMIPATLIGVIISIAFYIYFGASDITDLVVAKSLPRYPNTTAWTVTGSTGFPDGSPSSVVYLETKDSTNLIQNYYDLTLIKKGWKLETNQETYPRYSREFGTQKLMLNLQIDIQTDQTSRGIITISHE